MMANSTGPDVLLRSSAYHRGLHYSLNCNLFEGAVPRPVCGRICVCVARYFRAVKFTIRILSCGYSFYRCMWLIDALPVGTKTGDPYIGSTRFCSFS